MNSAAQATAEPVGGTEAVSSRSGRIQRRLLSTAGLILFAYVLTHLLNHALGLISLAAQEEGRQWFLLIWRNAVGTTVLYGALLVHVTLALSRLYQRRSLKMSGWEAAQLLLGLTIPLLLIEHILGTRLAHELFDLTDNYFYVELVVWKLAPMLGVMQVAMLLIAWLHGCIGLHFWLRIKPWYPRAAPLLYAGALLVPLLAILGFVQGGREIARLAAEYPDRLALAMKAVNFPGQSAVESIGQLLVAFRYAFVAILAAILLARIIRAQIERRRGLVRVSYPGGRSVQMPPGLTLLEISRAAGIPHASVCGGRGRCSTCRVRVNSGLDDQPLPSPAEIRVLQRVGAPPGVRLACQLRPVGNLSVTPLLPPTATARDAYGRPRHLEGEERVIAILFADLRAFTKFAERKLPYDVVFVLNRYFSAMGNAIERSGGKVDKFIGDGVMALFGIDDDPGSACRSALRAARAMAEQLGELNRTLAHDLPEPLRIGIGIHVGPAIVGEMGYARAIALTAIGDAVNIASRLESITKDYQAELVISEEVARFAGVGNEGFERHQIMVRGRQEPLAILVIANALAMPERTPGHLG
ncbi:MAG TPA: adenylate/guanylate cyclase domain-containing protein [Alphaproteobacteria bacterium]|nr:adenylate/guanylate cyclase domain-containing protein [Alphaproteobacteria bacterium]